MRLARVGPRGEERPAVVTDDGTAVDVSAQVSDFDAHFFARGGLGESKLIFSPQHIVWYLSQMMVLEPGDLVLTGTPPGVGLATGSFLETGDVVELAIEGLGSQRAVCRPADGGVGSPRKGPMRSRSWPGNPPDGPVGDQVEVPRREFPGLDIQ